MTFRFTWTQPLPCENAIFACPFVRSEVYLADAVEEDYRRLGQTRTSCFEFGINVGSTTICT